MCAARLRLGSALLLVLVVNQAQGRRLTAIASAPGPAIATATATSAGSDRSTSGVSSITPEEFPLPSSAYRLVQDGQEVVYGPNVVADRIAMERGLLNGTTQFLEPYGISNRYTNYTTHPSQTPGLQNYTAVEERLVEYVSAPQNVVTLNAQLTNLATQQLETFVAGEEHLDIKVLIQFVRTIHSYNATGPETGLNITKLDTADVKSRVQLRGRNLVPLHFDKQTLLLETLHDIWMADNVPVALLNFSDWRAAENTASNPAPGSDGIETIEVDIWTTLLPPDNFTATTVWADVAPPDGRVWNRTGQFNVSMNVTFLNATTVTRNTGQEFAVVSYSSASAAASSPASAAGAPSPGLATAAAATTKSGGGLSTGGIIGIAIAAVVVVLLALLLAGLLIRRRRQQQPPRHAHVKALLAAPDLSGGAGGWGDDALKKGLILAQHAGEIDPSEFVICKDDNGEDVCLGEGNFGKVYKAIRHGTSEVAVKHMDCMVDDPQKLHQMRREIAIMKKVSYDQNIVQFYGACTADNGAWLMMEYMEGGDLRKAVWKDAKAGTHIFDWDNRGKHVALAIARGLHFLHQHDVIHRDVKSSNILLTRDNVAKVADVGLATMTDYFSSSSNTHGTFMYAAPEVLMGRPSTAKVDSFSFGVVLWELITKEQSPRGNWRPVRVPAECPPEVEALLRDCINEDADQRPSMKQIVDRLLAVEGLPADGPVEIKADQVHVPSAMFDSANSL